MDTQVLEALKDSDRWDLQRCSISDSERAKKATAAGRERTASFAYGSEVQAGQGIAAGACYSTSAAGCPKERIPVQLDQSFQEGEESSLQPAQGTVQVGADKWESGTSSECLRQAPAPRLCKELGVAIADPAVRNFLDLVAWANGSALRGCPRRHR